MMDGSRWLFSRQELIENSPSRQDGIDWNQETRLRKSYSAFLQELGKNLRLPQGTTIATAITFCHRFFLRQSHAKNDRITIATACMFLAGKVENTPYWLEDVIVIAHRVLHADDPEARRRIEQSEVYRAQRELILLAENVVLATLGFDMNVAHPYGPLMRAMRKFNVARKAELGQIAIVFVNDGLRTSLCLQFKPRHVTAGVIYLASRFLRVELLPPNWWRWHDFEGVSLRQLGDICDQLLELYEEARRMQQHVDVRTEDP